MTAPTAGKPAPGKLSRLQRDMVLAMYELGAYGAACAEARDLAAETGQSPDGAAATLRSLVRRWGLVQTVTSDGQPTGYQLTAAGLAEARAAAAG